MLAGRRDHGLARVVTGPGLAATLVNSIVGAGIFAVPAALAASAGPYAPLAFVLCAVAIGAVAICFAEGGSRIPTSGGPYGYIEAALGPLAGFIAGILLWIGNMLGCASVAAALADVVVSVLPKAAAAPVHPAAIVSVIGGMALVNTAGVSYGTGLVKATTALKLMPLAVFLIAGAGAMHRANFLPGGEPVSAGLGRALILALFAFTGMEGPLCASGEVAQPARAIPRALGFSMLSVTALYVAIQIVAQGVLGRSLPSSQAPLADAMTGIHPALRVLMLAGAAVSMFSWIGSDILGTPRMLFAFARDGVLPRALGRLHPATHVPHFAILAYSALTIAFAATGSFAELAVVSTLAVAVVYMLGCVAAWRLARRGVSLAGPPLNFRWLTAALVIGGGSMVVVIALASRAEILGLLALTGGAVLVYVVRFRARPALRATATPER